MSQDQNQPSDQASPQAEEDLIPKSFVGREFAVWASDNSLRINRILPLATAYDCDEMIEDFEELINESTDEDLGKTFGQDIVDHLTAWRKDAKKNKEKWTRSLLIECISEFIYSEGKYGYILFLSTPVRDYTRDLTFASCMYSWGYSHTKTMYVDDLNADAVKSVFAWLTSRIENDKKESKKRAENGDFPKYEFRKTVGTSTDDKE